MTDYEHVIDDLHAVVEAATAEHPDLPWCWSATRWGLVAARYAQRHGDRPGAELRCWAVGSKATDLLGLPEIPDVPLDPATLSRDPAVREAYAADELVWHGPFKRPTLESLGNALSPTR